MNRYRETGGLLLAGCASLLVLSGCSSTDNEAPAASKSSSTTISTTSTSSAAALPGKEAFCRDVNTVVNIQNAPGTTLSDAQTSDMINALKSASDVAPSDVTPEFMSAITSMLADLQAPTSALPPSFNTNATNVAQYAGDYCG